jgi:hypothetical protein
VDLFNEFLLSNDSLRVYEGKSLIFSSDKDGLLPLLEYLEKFELQQRQVQVFDRIMGNAAALLSIKANAREVYSPFGSELAVNTLDGYGIRHHILELVPCIQNSSREGMCPMEELSQGKGPDYFYGLVRKKLR